MLSALLEIDHQGDMVSQEFTRGVIRSAERMTYTNVFRVLEGDAAMRERYAQLVDRFELMRELALILNRKRTKRGSIDFDMPEPNIEFDQSGQMTGVTRGRRNIAHRIIEEFMLAANEAVAGHLEQAGIPSLYRIHEKPGRQARDGFRRDRRALRLLAGHRRDSGETFPVTQKAARRAQGAQRHRAAAAKTSISRRGNYQQLIAKIAGKPEERILSYLMLRSLKQARYSNTNEGTLRWRRQPTRTSPRPSAAIRT